MKIPSKISRTCKKCGKSSFSVKEVKKGPVSSTTLVARRIKRWGSRGNLGRYSKVPAKKVKTSKKPNLLITCVTCNVSTNLCRPRCVKYTIKKI